MGKIKKKIALITGITGQDGSYLAELLLKKNYTVHGIVRHVALENDTHRISRLRKIKNRIIFESGSLENYASLVKIIKKVKPDEIYHLAAQSYVSYSFDDQFSTMNSNINGTHYMLAAIKEFSPKSRFYFAASSEMFGKVREEPQSENTPFHPRSPYGISKVTGYELTRNYREAYNLFCCSGILFNHESPRRGFEFVTRKISHAVARIKLGKQSKLYLGNISAKRDWGHAADYVEIMWKMLQLKKAEDFVVGTGKMHSVKDFAKLAFQHVDLDYKKFIKIDKKFFRPSEVDSLRADYKKAKKLLNWKPKTSFKKLVEEMVDVDLALVSQNED